ncbi:MAG: hypothetical protein GEV12_08610 [Micromonosporaceae bacterium]|nr:hypothetical protein [Micromonosporaceae bacterium]
MPKLTANLVFEALRSVSFCGDPAAVDEYLADTHVPDALVEPLRLATGIVADHAQRGDHGHARLAALRLSENLAPLLSDGRANRVDEEDNALADALHTRRASGEMHGSTTGYRPAAGRTYQPSAGFFR